MEKTAEQVYTDLLRILGNPTVVEPEALIGYLRDVERLHSTGHITAWQLDRARDAYRSTLDRDPRQRPQSDLSQPVAAAGSENLDPITGTRGAHPIGTGVGAALGGAVAGAAIGTVAGPVGTLVGASIGAIIGGLAGKGVAELVDPTAEETYWRSQYATRPYVPSGAAFDDFGPAYAHGAKSFASHGGRAFEEVDTELAQAWAAERGGSTLDWERARPASRDAWDRVGQRQRDSGPSPAATSASGQG